MKFTNLLQNYKIDFVLEGRANNEADNILKFY